MLWECDRELLTPPILDAITKVYETPMVLYKAYLQCKNAQEAKLLIFNTIHVQEVDDADFEEMLQFLNKDDWTQKELSHQKRIGLRMEIISIAIYESFGPGNGHNYH